MENKHLHVTMLQGIAGLPYDYINRNPTSVKYNEIWYISMRW